jgi:GTP-binding protein
VLLMDTGGLFPPGDGALAESVKRSVMDAAGRADVIVMVVDGRAGVTGLDRDLARMFRATGRRVLLAVNKMDDPARESGAAEFHELGFETVLAISAEHGHGIEALREAVSEGLPSETEILSAGTAREVTLAIGGRPNVGKS